MYSAMTWLSTAVLRLSKRPAKPFGKTKTELLPANSAAETGLPLPKPRCTGNNRAGGKDSTVARPTHGSRLLRLALMGQASRSRKGRAMITLSCEEVRREISNYLDDDMSPSVRRLLETHLEQCRKCAVLLEHAQCACLAGRRAKI
jgi:Putative zinc-finger